MLFGALILQTGISEDNLLQAASDYRVINHLKAEMKWGKVSRGMLPIYKGYIDLFFQSAAEFRCLVVDTHRIDYARFHKNNRETAFYNFYCLLLSRNLEPNARYLIFTDERNNRETNRLSELKKSINSFWNEKGVGDDIVRNIEPRVSKDSEPLQLVDIMLGAVGYDMEEFNTSEPKLELVKHIAQQVGTTSLREHRGRGTQFNIWVFDFERANKKADSRPNP